jgi:ubiquinone/menaquinone biosynthesis C-methylase UbiE
LKRANPPHVADLHALLQKSGTRKAQYWSEPMAEHSVCPWWIGYVLASPIRKLLQNPAGIIAPYIRDGMTVLEPGPGMGFFTLEIARRVGPSGHVIAVDSQPQMIEGLKRRARKAGVLDRIEARVVPTNSMALDGLEGTVDFTFAFAVVHEMPSAGSFFAEAARAMKHGARLLLAEPAGHVREAEFREELEVAAVSGLKIVDRPSLMRCITALLQRNNPEYATPNPNLFPFR